MDRGKCGEGEGGTCAVPCAQTHFVGDGAVVGSAEAGGALLGRADVVDYVGVIGSVLRWWRVCCGIGRIVYW